MSGDPAARAPEPAATRSYRGLYLLVLAALAADIALLAWLTRFGSGQGR